MRQVLRPPFPSRPQHVGGQRLHEAWRNVDQQTRYLPRGDGLQVIANRVDVPTIAEGPTGFNHMPSGFDETLEGLLGLETIKLSKR